MSYIWDLIQQRQIRDVDNTASGARSAATQNSAHARSLDEHLDRLTLLCRAMWEILRDREGISEDVLLSKVQEIDLRDGTLDGKFSNSKKCPSCNRPSSPKHVKRIYCGQSLGTDSAFDKV